MSSFGENIRQASSGNQGGSLAARLGFQDPDRKNPQHDEIMLWLDQFVREWQEEFIGSVPEPEDSYHDEPGMWVTWELPVGDPRWIAGFIDLYLQVGRKAQYWTKTYKLAFEVKTVLPSLGDLIRQIRFYQEKWGGSPPVFYVVSSDTKHIATLRNQGIGFVEYPSGEITHPVQ